MQNLHQEPNNSPHTGITSSCVTLVWSKNRQIVGKIIMLFSSCHPCPFGVNTITRCPCSKNLLGMHTLTKCPCSKSLLCPFPEHIPRPTSCARMSSPTYVSTALYMGKLTSAKEKGLGIAFPLFRIHLSKGGCRAASAYPINHISACLPCSQ